MLLTAHQCNSTMRMLLLLVFIFYSSASKVKRDVNDLKNDSVLSAVFSSDVQEKRNDRSISPLDESFGKNYNNKDDQKRDIGAEFQNNFPFEREGLVRDGLSSSITPFFPQSDSLDARLYNSQPMISNPISLPPSEVSDIRADAISSEEKYAVNPALFAANYLPLPGSNLPEQKMSFQETKRTFVPHKESTNTNEISPVEIKSAIATHSSPLQLRINSPNAKLRGIVPHVPEYGETVQSVRKVQKEIDWKRNFIPYPQQQSYAWTPPFFKMAPQTMYSNEIYKRNSIPHPPATEHRNRISKRSKGTKTSKKSNKKTNKKKNAKKQKSTKKSNIDNSNKRQFIAQQQQPYMYPQYNTYLPTFDQNPYALQQNILQQPYLNTFQQQQAVTSQVRNMDGMETKPLVSSEPCSDQYISCTDFAKNNYCTNYPELMKIQCRKSCRYCIPTNLDNTNMENKTTDSQLPSTDSLMQFAANKTAATSLDNENAQNKNTTVTIADNDSSNGSGSGDSDSGSGSGSDADDDKVDTYIAPVPQKKSAVKKISNVKEKVKTNKKNSTIHSHEKLDTALKKESTPKSNSTLVTVKKLKSPQNKTKTFVQHKTDTSSGSGMSEGSGESQSGSGSSDNKIVTTKKSNIKMVLPTKEERNKIWQPKESPTHNLGEFSLPVKKNIIPMPSLNIVSMKTGSDDVSDSSGSGSGESGDESGSEATHDVTSTKKNVVVADNQQQNKEKKKSLPKVAADTPNVAPSKKSSNKMNTDKQKAKKVYSVPKKEQQLSIKPQRRPKEKSTTNKTSNIKSNNVDKTKSVKKVKTKTNQPAKQVKQKKLSNKSTRKEKKSKKKNKSKKKTNNNKVKKMKIPLPPAFGSAYPRIDLKSIASALAHYEEAAMELAGEYPNPSGNIDITEYQRSMIPHPSTRQIGSMDRYRQNIQIAKILQSERSKKDNIPEYLKVSSDAKKAESESDSIDADNLDLVRQRFNVPGVEPTLNDYYAETGKLNPFEKKKRKVKKSRIEVEKRMRKWNSFQHDPYEYLRNMPPGASMEPIEDPKARSAIPPDHSFPVILMKVSPGENKYVSEDASKRGKIRKLDAEGLPIEDNQQKPSPPATAPAESRHSVPEIPPPQQPVPYYPLPPQPLQSPFENMPGQQQAAGFPYPPSAFIERNSAPQVNEAFAQQPAVNMEQAPNHLRSKMLSAFFSIKNAIPMEEGSGGGEAVSRDSISTNSAGSGSIDVAPSKKTISLQSLLFNDDSTKKRPSIANVMNQQENELSPQEASSNYLQSNLAALTPESTKSGGTDGEFAANAELTSKMSKTQETDWMRPNAESELASALPGSSDRNSKEDEKKDSRIGSPSSGSNIGMSSPKTFNNAGVDGRYAEQPYVGIEYQHEDVNKAYSQDRASYNSSPKNNAALIPFFTQEEASFVASTGAQDAKKQQKTSMPQVRKFEPTWSVNSKFTAPNQRISTDSMSNYHRNKPAIKADDLPPATTDFVKYTIPFSVSHQGAKRIHSNIKPPHIQRKQSMPPNRLKQKTPNRIGKPLQSFVSKVSRIQTSIKTKQQQQKQLQNLQQQKQSRKRQQQQQKQRQQKQQQQKQRQQRERQQRQQREQQRQYYTSKQVNGKQYMMTDVKHNSIDNKKAIAQRSKNLQNSYNPFSSNTLYQSPAQYMMFSGPKVDTQSRFPLFPLERETIQRKIMPTNKILFHQPVNSYSKKPYALPAVNRNLLHGLLGPLRSSIDSNDQETIIESFLQSNNQDNYGIADALYDRSSVPHHMMLPWTYDVLSTESASLQQPQNKKSFSNEQNQQRASVRDQVPKSPLSNYNSQSTAQRKKDTIAKSLKHKLINKNIFSSETPKSQINSPSLTIASGKDTIDKSLLSEFPKSPFTAKSTINPAQQTMLPNQQAYYSSYPLPVNYPGAFARYNIPNEQPIASQYSWRQYLPYNQNAVNIQSDKKYSSFESKPNAAYVHNEQSSSLTANIGAAKYALSQKSKLENKPTNQHIKGQYDGWDYIVQKPDTVKPLIMTTNEEDHTVSLKNSSFNSVLNEESKTTVKKNLIKQKPDLDCGADWEGAAGDFGTFCYKVMKTKVTFDDALKECRRLKSDLFSVLNAYENRYLEDNLRSKFWIGYRDKGMDGNWKWTDNSRSFYTNWASSSIIDSSKSHDCVYIDGEEGQWKDEMCSKKKPFLCKTKAEACPKGWKNLKLNSVIGCYKLFNEPKTWEDAEVVCQQQKSHLASVTSENEQTMVFQVHSSKSFWIGFNDRESEGDWQWTDRMTSSYTNWAEKSPNNGGVSCALMTPHGKWRDQPCNEKNMYVCKKKGPKPEKNDGLDGDGVLLPVSRLLNNVDTAPSHVFDELAKNGQRPVVPLYYWPLLKTARSGMAGNRPMAAHGDVRSVPGGVALDGINSFLDGGDFHGKCLTDPDKCTKGFAVAIQVYFAQNVRKYDKPHCIVDTSGGGKGFTIFIAKNKLNYRVKLKDISWELRTDLIVERWQELVMTWHRSKGISVYVNGAFKDSESVGIQVKESNGGTSRLIVGRESKEKGPYTCTKMVVASVAIFTKMLSVEDVPYAFTYGDTVAASYRWLMSGLDYGLIKGAPKIEQRQSLIDVDGGIYIDGDTGWFEITDFDDIFSDPAKAKHGFALSFKVKFDQRVREYKEPKYILDTGGNVNGIRGISVYILNDNLYFRVVSTPDEDTMIWKVRTPIYTVRWQQVVFTWRLDKGLWVYLDGSFRGYTKIPETLPGTSNDVSKLFFVGRKIIGTPVGGAQFAFGSLALYSRYLTKQDSENVFGGVDNPFPGIIREVWKNTPGENITALEANPDYPNNPSTIEIIENFDSPFNVDGDYGSKLKGYFIAPETGNSTFYLSCSRSCELYFSSDEEAKNKTKIIALRKPTWHNQWNRYANQSSKELFLVAGKYYYLEAIHKGVETSDTLSVGVRMPTGRYQRPISKENLQWRLPGNQHAGLIREVWYNIPGYTIADLTSNSNFPNRPSSTEILDKFDAPFNVDDNYGSRLSGYFHAPETGDFRFYLSSDSSGELWISSDDSEANLVKIISLNGWTDHNQWLKYPEQKSDKIFLASSRYYYIRVYMKADKLGDCASVAVELPSGHFEGPIKKKHLSWKIPGSKDGPGPGEIVEAMPKPIGLFPLDESTFKNEQAIGKPSLTIGDVELTTGPGGLKDSAFLFKGKESSYVEIPNKKGELDAKDSITILANIYPTGEDGPIINYKKDGWGVHLWQFSGAQLFVRFVTREGHMTTQPLGTRVLELNKWNQVGASYDKSSGVAQLWHDGKMVKSRNIGQVELLTNAPIRLGSRDGDDRHFEGKISCIQIYKKALKERQIGELRKCPKETKGSQADFEDLSMFSPGSGMQPAFEDIEALENRLGDDTEEELIVQGDRNKATRCEPNPCENNGVCLDDDKKIDGYVCSCSSDFTGKRCQVSRPAAENPIVKRTEIPKSYEQKNGVEAYASSKQIDDATEKKEDMLLLYQKIGCFKDEQNSRDLKRPVKLQKLTQERCAKACALDNKGFSYFGLQNGTSCYCGRNYGKYGKISDDSCNINCEGDSDETCGGVSANNIYFFGLGTNYTVKTFTGQKLGAGTDAKIYLELIGERGSSDFRKLDDGIDKYEPGSVDSQKILLPDLGRLKRMKILHDNTGTAPSWYLDKVEVNDENGRSFEFNCNDWLSDTQSGGKLERELQARSIP